MPQTNPNTPNKTEPQQLTGSADLTQLHNALERLDLLKLERNTTLEALAFQCKEVSQIALSCKRSKVKFDDIKQMMPESLAACLSVSENGFQALHCIVKLIDELPQELWCFRDDMYDNPKIDYVIAEMSDKVAFLKPLQAKLAHFVDVGKLPDINTLLANQKIIESAGLFRWFSPRWRRAKRTTMALSNHHKLKLVDMVSLFPAMITYVDARKALDEIHCETAILGDTYEGIDTPLERMTVLRAWYKNIRFETDYGFSGNADIGPGLFTLDPILAETLQLTYTKHLSQSIVKLDRQVTKLRLTYSGHLSLMMSDESIPDSVTELAEILREQYAILADSVTDHRISLHELKRVLKAEESEKNESFKTIIT